MRHDELYVADLVDSTRAVREYLDGISREHWDRGGAAERSGGQLELQDTRELAPHLQAQGVSGRTLAGPSGAGPSFALGLLAVNGAAHDT
jgi:hypothetical protein